MKMRLMTSLAGLAALLAISTPVLAHHGNAAYDESKLVTLKGTVTEFLMINPHSIINLDVKDDSGNVQHWAFDWGCVRCLKEAGWTKDTVKTGDEVTVFFNAAKNGTNIGLLRKMQMPDGRMLYDSAGALERAEQESKGKTQ
jgi:hypothetical protein